MPQAASGLSPRDLLPHENAAQVLWDASDDSWVRAPRRERSTLRIIGGVLLILLGANLGQAALGASIGLIAAISMHDSSALLSTLAIVLGCAAVGGLFLYLGIKMVSGKSSRDR